MVSWKRVGIFSFIVRKDVLYDISSSINNVDIIIVKIESGTSNTKTSIRLFDVNNDDIVDNLYCTFK